MSSDHPECYPIDPSPFSFAIVAARYNEKLAQALLVRVEETIKKGGMPKELITERVPGSHEIPAALKMLLQSKTFSCLIALGVVVKGGTSHHHLVADSAGQAIQSLVVEYGTPIINGIIVTDDYFSAETRITGSVDRGNEFAQAALQMAQLKMKWTST